MEPPERWQTLSVIEQVLATLRSDIDGQLIDRGRVMDHLLDLRADSRDMPAFLATVDQLLAELPGVSVVETSWWSGALDRLEAAAGTVPAA